MANASFEQETAVNIAVSCRLVSNPDDVMTLNVDDKADSELSGARLRMSFPYLAGCSCSSAPTACCSCSG